MTGAAGNTGAGVLETLTFRGGFNTNTVIVGTTLLGVAAGVVGVFALLRKRSLVTDALSHATLPGIALAFLFATALGMEGKSLPVLLAGGAASGVAGIGCIQWLMRHTRLREDAAIGIVLSVFFGAGVVALSVVQSSAPSGAAGLSKFIYGQTAAMRRSDAVLMGVVAVAAVLSTVLLLKEFTTVCFNDAFARVSGWPVSVIDLLMMGLVVVVTVVGLQAVGLILVVALLIVPPVAARFWSERVWVIVAVSGAIGGVSGYLGAVLSSLAPRKPAGAVIVLTAGAVFAVSMVAAPSRGVVASLVRRARFRVRTARDHLVEFVFEHPGAAALNTEIERFARKRGWSGWFRRAMVWSVASSGLAERGAEGVRLTPQGAARGARVARNHRLWEQYLISCADVAPSHVDWSVDQVEHVLSDELVGRLERALAARGVQLPEAQAGGTGS